MTAPTQCPRIRISNVREQFVLKKGLVFLRDELVIRRKAPILDFPKRNGHGAPFVMQVSFFKRLLSEEFELKQSMGSDIASAQMDLRHLSVEQLLCIRVRTLDFATESSSHDKHNSFLEIVDRHLFAKLSQKFFDRRRSENAWLWNSVAPTERALHAMGIHITLILGCLELLANGYGLGIDGFECLRAPPLVWIILLEDESWPECRAALFHSGELWAGVLSGKEPGIADAIGEETCVSVVCQRSTGIGKDRVLHWIIHAMDPRTDDVYVFEERDGVMTPRQHRSLSAELETVLSTPRKLRKAQTWMGPSPKQQHGCVSELDSVFAARRESPNKVWRSHRRLEADAAAATETGTKEAQINCDEEARDGSGGALATDVDTLIAEISPHQAGKLLVQSNHAIPTQSPYERSNLATIPKLCSENLNPEMMQAASAASCPVFEEEPPAADNEYKLANAEVEFNQRQTSDASTALPELSWDATVSTGTSSDETQDMSQGCSQPPSSSKNHPSKSSLSSMAMIVGATLGVGIFMWLRRR